MTDKNNIYNILNTINKLEPEVEQLTENTTIVQKEKTLFEKKMEEVLAEKYANFDEGIMDTIKGGAKKFANFMDPDYQANKMLTPDQEKKNRKVTAILKYYNNDIETVKEKLHNYSVDELYGMLFPNKQIDEDFLPRTGFDDYIKNLKRNEDVKIIDKEFGLKKAKVRYSLDGTTFEVVWTAGQPHPKKRQVHDEPGIDKDEEGNKISTRGRGRPKGSTSGARQQGSKAGDDDEGLDDTRYSLRLPEGAISGIEQGMSESVKGKVRVYANKFGYFVWSPKLYSHLMVFDSNGDLETHDSGYKSDQDKLSAAKAVDMKPIEFSALPDKAKRVIGRTIFNQGVAEGAMSELDIERQEYEEMTDEEFEKAYGMTKEEWFETHKDLLNEKAKNPYAIGMAQAMKSTGDKPPLKKSTITKAHKIAKKIDESVIDRMINESYENLFFEVDEEKKSYEEDLKERHKDSKDKDDNKKDVKENTMDNELAEMMKLAGMKVEGKECNHTEEGKSCPVHGLKECGGMYESEDLEEEDVEEGGNAFLYALAQAKKDGKKEFEVDGKTYKVNEDADIDINKHPQSIAYGEGKKECEECEGEGCSHCDGKGYHEIDDKVNESSHDDDDDEEDDGESDEKSGDSKGSQDDEPKTSKKDEDRADESIDHMLKLAGVKSSQQIEECYGDMKSPEQEGRMNVSTNMSSDGTKSVTITADGDAAVQLMQMLKLAGMNSAEPDTPTIAIATHSPEEEIYPTSEDEQMEEVENVMGNSPQPEIMPVQRLTKGGDGEVAGKEKQMIRGGYKFSDNPLAMEDNIFSGRFLKEYESIKAKR